MGEKLAMVDDFKEEVRLENEIKKKESDKQFYGNQYTEVFSPNGDHTKIKTDKELAKMAGVSAGTVARYDTVMSCDDERGSNGMDDQYTIR